MTVTTHRFVHLIVRALQAQLRQLMVETQRQAARFRIGKIVTTNAGIQPFHAVQDQAINRVAGGKCQTAENVVIEIGKRIGVIGHFLCGRQHFLRFVRMLTKRGANEDGGDVGPDRQQIVDQLRDAFVIETRQRFKNIQSGGFPEIIHLRRFAMLNGQPTVSRQTLQHFT